MASSLKSKLACLAYFAAQQHKYGTGAVVFVNLILIKLCPRDVTSIRQIYGGAI